MSESHAIVLGNMNLTVTEDFKYLDINLDTHLMYRVHIQSLIRNDFLTVRSGHILNFLLSPNLVNSVSPKVIEPVARLFPYDIRMILSST